MAKGKNDNLLPDGSGGPEESADIGDLRVDFSTEEASSEALSFDPIPTGSYNVAITEVEVKKSTSEKNPGKPYWAITMVVQDGPHENRKLWGNVMLWNGALYSLAQLMKAIGKEDVLESGQIPDGQTLIGEKLTVNVIKTRDKYKEEREDDGEKYFKNEIKGYKKSKEGSASGASGSLMP